MHDIDLIEDWSMIILYFILPGLGALGVFFHAYLNYRLSFFKYEDDKSSKRKKTTKRMVIPWLTIAVLSAIVPVAIAYSNTELLESLKTPNIHGQVMSPWKYFLPVINWEITIPACFIAGSLYYIAIGFVLLIAGKIFRWA